MERKMRVSICDDEAAVRELIAHKVRKLCTEAKILFFTSGEELLLAKDFGDILFLDIQMKDMDGMETARKLRADKFYLIKPFDDKKFAEVFSFAVKQWEEHGGAGEIFSAKNMEEKGKYLFVKKSGLSTKVFLEDIIYAEVLNRKVTLHGRDGDLEYYGKLSELEQIAGEDFFRSHRAYLINFKYVERYSATEIILEKGCALMAKKNYSAFVKKFMKYNQRREG